MWRAMATGKDILNLVEGIHLEKEIDREFIFQVLEDALLAAARKIYGPDRDLAVFVDRETGEVAAFDGTEEIDTRELGRIAAQTAKQVVLQRIREAENDAIYEEFKDKEGALISGPIQRFEGATVYISLGRTEGTLPRREQVPGEAYRPGVRLRCLVLEVKRLPGLVRILLSRAHPDFVRRLFELEVPEIQEGLIKIVNLVREPGYRSKVAVATDNPKVDAVGACVGIRGARIRNVIAELSGERIDIVRWTENAEELVANSLKPAEVQSITLNLLLKRARAIVSEDQLSLAIGRKGQNVRLASKLCGWEIDVLRGSEAEEEQAELVNALAGIEGLSESDAKHFYKSGFSLAELACLSPKALADHFSVNQSLASEIVQRSQHAMEELARKHRQEAELEEEDEAES